MMRYPEIGGPEALPGTAKDARRYSTLQAAIESLSAGDTLIVPKGTYTVSSVITCSTAGVHIHFENPTINIADNGTSGTLTNTSSGKIGLFFKSADHITLTGKAKLMGQGTAGTTTLALLVFDSCDYVKDSVEWFMDTAAAGRMVFWCDYSSFGNITANLMKGQQTFGSGTAGTAEVVVGCQYSNFGTILSKQNYKPIRYLSVAADASAAKIDNAYCNFGFVTGTVATSSIEGSALAIRSAKYCNFDGCSGDGFSNGLYLVRYNTDTGWSVTGNRIKTVTGNYPATGASVDAALLIDAPSGYEIGNNQIGSVAATCAGEWGFFIDSGNTQIDSIDIVGSPTRGGMVHSASAQISKASFSGQGYEAFLYGQGAKLDMTLIDVRSGYASGGSGAIVYNSSYGSGGQLTPTINTIRYKHNSIGTNYNYIFVLLTGGADKAAIYHIDGTAGTNQCYFEGDDFQIKYGRAYSAAAPTANVYSDDFVVWKVNASAGGSPGWFNVGASGSNSWKTMATMGA